MKMYKVTFNDNEAVTSEDVDFSNKINVEMEYPNGKKTLKSITIFAGGEQESITTAKGIASYAVGWVRT